MLGSVLDKMGEDKTAQAQYRKALRLEPYNVIALNNLAYSLARTADSLDEAERLAERAITQSDDSVTRHTLKTIREKRKAASR